MLPSIISPAAPYILILFSFLVLLVISLLAALVEGVVLTLLSWAPFRASLTISVLMNLASGLLNGIVLIVLQDTPLFWIPISFTISLLVEVFILSGFKRANFRRNLLFAFLVNLASYLLLIIPAYYFGAQP